MKRRLTLAVEPRPSAAPVHAPPLPLAIWAKGFRPFFLLAGIWAAAIVPLWLAYLAGAVEVGGHLAPTYWHAHEMVFGFAVAVVAGFLLTAATNWTGRETAIGPALILLAAIWLAGRLTLLAGDAIPAWLAAGANLAFLPALAIAAGRSIVGARDARNAGFLVVLALLFAAQLAVHLDALGLLPGGQRTGVLVGVDLIVLLILLVGGRVIPMFTRNATGAQTRSYPWLDRGALAAMVVLVAVDVAGAPPLAVAVVAGIAGVLAAARAVQWGARSSLRDPLLWVLHLGYAFVPIGLLLRAASGVTPAVSSSVATHALTVGAIGLLTLGMMARVSLGHTGRPLRVGRAIRFAFGALALAAIVRVIGAWLGPRGYLPSLHAAGTLWTLAFTLFLIRYVPVLLHGRPDGKPG